MRRAAAGPASRAAVALLAAAAGAAGLQFAAPPHGSLGPAGPKAGSSRSGGKGPAPKPTSVILGTVPRVHFAYVLPEGPVHGVFLFLHACQRHSLDWFRGSGAFPGEPAVGGGLPEESAMADAVLERGFAALAPDSQPFPGGCWRPAVDAAPVAVGLAQLLQQLGLGQVPLYGVGASSGGVLLSVLAGQQGIAFKALHFNVSPGAATAVGSPGLFARPGWPRASFVHMKRDKFAPPAAIQAAAATLQQAGTQVQVIEVHPQPLEELPNRSARVGMYPGDLRVVVKDIIGWGLTEQRGRQRVVYLRYDQVNAAALRLYYSCRTAKELRKLRSLEAELGVFEGVHAPTAEHFRDRVVPFMLGGKP